MIQQQIRTISELQAYHAKKYKEKILAFFPKEDKTITYEDLYHQSLSFADFFSSKGIEQGSRIALIVPTSRSFLLSFSGLLHCGAIVYPLDHKMQVEDAARNIEKFRTEYIICLDELDSYIQEIMQIASKMLSIQKIILTADSAINTNQLDPKNKYSVSFHSSNQHDTPALCIFTSGTTGDPKGVLLSQKNILTGALNLKYSHQLTSHDRVLSATPLSGINGNIFSFWAPLLTGGSAVYYQEMFTPYRVFELLDTYQATWFNGIPTHYALLVKMPVDISNFNLSSLRFMRSASAPLPASIQEEFEKMYHTPIIETMGITEMTGQVCSNPLELKKRKIKSVGKPVNTEVKIVDQKGNNLAENRIGEILFRGDGLMLCYFDDNKATHQAIVDGWLYSGDLGYIDHDGYVFVSGRKKDIVIVGGKNVSMREIENILYAHPKISEAAAFGIPHEVTGEQIIAIIRSHKKEVINIDQIYSHCRNHLSSYKCPNTIEQWEQFPKGGQGKILKSKVKEKFLEGMKSGA